MTALLNHRFFEGLFDGAEVTFDGRAVIFNKRRFLEDRRISLLLIGADAGGWPVRQSEGESNVGVQCDSVTMFSGRREPDG